MKSNYIGAWRFQFVRHFWGSGPVITEVFRVSLNGYRGSCWDRGHPSNTPLQVKFFLMIVFCMQVLLRERVAGSYLFLTLGKHC